VLRIAGKAGQTLHQLLGVIRFGALDRAGGERATPRQRHCNPRRDHCADRQNPPAFAIHQPGERNEHPMAAFSMAGSSEVTFP